MIPYLVLLLVPLLFSLVASANRVRNQKRALLLGTGSKIRNESLLLPVFFVILFFLLAMRDETIGNDTHNYKTFFSYYSRLGLEEVLDEQIDRLYWLLNWIVGQITEKFQVFLAVVAGLITIPLACLYCEDRRSGFLKLVLFVNMSTFVMLFSGLRQALAMTFGVVAYRFVREKKLLWFLVFALIALGFHHTGFMVFSLYPLYHIAFKKKHLWFIIPGVLLVYIFNQPIFSTAVRLLTSLFGEKYDTEIEATGAYTMLIVFVMFAILAYVLPDEKQLDAETLGLRNYLLAAVVLQCFAPVHTLAMRMNYYFIIFIPVLLPKIVNQPRKQWKGIIRILELLMIAFFLVYYLNGTYNSCMTGESALNTYPYVPFWK